MTTPVLDHGATLERTQLGPVALPDTYAWRRPAPRTASLPRRVAAFAADAAVVFLLAWLTAFIAAAVGLLRLPDVSLLGHPNEALSLLWIVSIFEAPILLAYTTLTEANGGRTLGKVLVGLRVRRLDGATPTLSDAFLRGLLRLLWVTPVGPAFVLLDFWAMQATELDQRMGDLAVGTIVVDERLEAASHT